ncbi:hypothetical protein KQX54_002838 [Cotesia glomerata]|uniref:Uncharacterized protein n=1 Tax=Cotesia glomerata TaxID=32391 RepID=A0AAV7I7S9_COTGL|nr:hypothetical protein KQX54_002838 [Cotesia glomerata]
MQQTPGSNNIRLTITDVDDELTAKTGPWKCYSTLAIADGNWMVKTDDVKAEEVNSAPCWSFLPLFSVYHYSPVIFWQEERDRIRIITINEEEKQLNTLLSTYTEADLDLATTISRAVIGSAGGGACVVLTFTTDRSDIPRQHSQAPTSFLH